MKKSLLKEVDTKKRLPYAAKTSASEKVRVPAVRVVFFFLFWCWLDLARERYIINPGITPN